MSCLILTFYSEHAARQNGVSEHPEACSSERSPTPNRRSRTRAARSGPQSAFEVIVERTSSPYLTAIEAGASLGLSPRTLERFRVQGRGPKFLKLGRRVAYSSADLVSWAEMQRRGSTSEAAARRVPVTPTRQAGSAT